MPRATQEEIQRRLGEELETILGLPAGSAAAGKPLHELGMDSFSLVELLVMIEREYGLSLLESGVTSDDFQSLDRLASVIHSNLT